MFYLVRQSFWQLGILVILLAVGFSLLFYLLKNLIDRLDRQRMYGAGVVLYTVSWLLRGRINGEMVAAELYMLLIMVKVGTSLFGWPLISDSSISPGCPAAIGISSAKAISPSFFWRCFSVSWDCSPRSRLEPNRLFA